MQSKQCGFKGELSWRTPHFISSQTPVSHAGKNVDTSFVGGLVSAFIQRYYENHHSQSHFIYRKSHQIMTYNKDQHVRKIKPSGELIINNYYV